MKRPDHSVFDVEQGIQDPRNGSVSYRHWDRYQLYAGAANEARKQAKAGGYWRVTEVKVLLELKEIK